MNLLRDAGSIPAASSYQGPSIGEIGGPFCCAVPGSPWGCILRGGFARGVQYVRGARGLLTFAGAVRGGVVATPCAARRWILRAGLGTLLARAKLSIVRGARGRPPREFQAVRRAWPRETR